MSQPTCFVVMGFGKKTDFETGRTLDLDKTYKNVIKPAVTAAGLQCIRADEIVHSGLIDIPMYQQLFEADLVIADLSTANRNAFYELGVRHALKPYATIVIAEDGIKPPFPFDVNHLAIRPYHHLGEDIGFDEAIRFQGELKEAIARILAARKIDSPVHSYLAGLAVRWSQPLGAGAAAGSPATAAPAGSGPTHSQVMREVEAAWARSDFKTARAKLNQVLSDMKQTRRSPDGSELPPDPSIVQRLALVTYKSKDLDELEALDQARSLLATLGPETSNDTETLGLWGAVHKRLWAKTNERAHLDEAIRSHERGFYLRNDYYNGINLAFLLNVRALQQASRSEAIADFVLARRVRGEVCTICNRWLELNPIPREDAVTASEMRQYTETRYWVLASKAEALLGSEPVESREDATSVYDDAYALPVEERMRASTRIQREQLEALLVDSPLRYVMTT